jgi:hypothetical protein
MNSFRHIFLSKKKNQEENKDLIKKEFLDELSLFAKNEPDFALQKLNSNLKGLNDIEVKKRL